MGYVEQTVTNSIVLERTNNMATCRECLHYDVCKMLYVLTNTAKHCIVFKNKSDYVKRERGEWIKEHRRFSTNYGWCAKPIFICSRCGTAYWSEQDFCEVCKADMRKEDEGK